MFQSEEINLLQMNMKDIHKTLISPSSNTRFFSTAHRFFIQSCLNIQNLLERTLHICLYFFTDIKSSHFSWLCHRPPPCRRSFSFCILQVLCRLLTPFSGHPQSFTHPPSLYASWQCLLYLLFSWFSLSSDFSTCFLWVTNWSRHAPASCSSLSLIFLH